MASLLAVALAGAVMMACSREDGWRVIGFLMSLISVSAMIMVAVLTAMIRMVA